MPTERLQRDVPHVVVIDAHRPRLLGRDAMTSSTRTAGISAIATETTTATSSSSANPPRAAGSIRKDWKNRTARPR